MEFLRVILFIDHLHGLLNHAGWKPYFTTAPSGAKVAYMYDREGELVSGRIEPRGSEMFTLICRRAPLIGVQTFDEESQRYRQISHDWPPAPLPHNKTHNGCIL